jgi:hypothetical protein
MRKTHAVALVLSLAAVTACDVLTPSMYKRDVTAVITGPPTLAAGETAQLSVSLSYSDDTVTPLGPPTIHSVVLASSNPAVATVSAAGLVTAISAGQTTITATPNAETTGTGQRIPGKLVITVVP